VASVLSAHMPEGSAIKSCEKGRLRQVSAYTFRPARHVKLSLPENATIRKGDTDLAVQDYLGQNEDGSLTIRFIGGRTISPVLIMEAFGADKLLPSEILKTETVFAGDNA
jgi:hypothetical protein